MKRHPIASTYARALLEVGQAAGNAEAFESELTALLQLFSEGSPRVFLQNPAIRRSDKLAVLEKGIKGQVSDPVFNFMMTLVKRGRQELLADICSAYAEALDDERGRVHVTLTSATPLAEELRGRLLELLSKRLGREVVPTEKLDENLLGGMTIRVGDTVIDGSVRAKLNKVRDAMKAARMGSELVQ